MRKTVVVACILLLTVPQGHTCTLARDYFYQVTVLRGRIVGIGNHSLRFLPWLRHSIARKYARLELRDYRSPGTRNDMPLVKAIETNADGKFDFGALKAGHYAIFIEDEPSGISDSFDVEIKDLPHPTESVTIDVSPFTPDCKGGHEFLIRTK